MLATCNRSCAGYEWIAKTRDALLKAPKWIQELVKSEPEQERFRFGNGGTLLSRERVRIPFMIGEHVVMIWISNVPCATLGCLLGKDVLDALGAVHDFLANRVKFQLLSSDHWFRLSRLAAGYYLFISFLPTPLSKWPCLSRMPWIGVGKAKVCEVQVQSRMQWMLRKLARVKHELGEPEIHVVCHEQSFGSSSWENRMPLGDETVPPRPTAQSLSAAMEPAAASPSSPESMALAWESPMDGAATPPTVPAGTTPFNIFGGRLGTASQGDGAARYSAQELPGRVLRHGQVHRLPSEGCSAAAFQDGSEDGFHGGCLADQRPEDDDAGKVSQEEDPRSSSQRDHEALTVVAGGTGEAVEGTTWTSRWSTTSEGRAHSGGSALEGGSSERGHGGLSSSQAEGPRSNADRQGLELGARFERFSPEPDRLQGIWADPGPSLGEQSTTTRISQSSWTTSTSRPRPTGSPTSSPTWRRRLRARIVEPDGGSDPGPSGVRQREGGRNEIPGGLGHDALSAPLPGVPGRDSTRMRPEAEESKTVKQSIGHVRRSQFRKLKKGMRMSIKQGFEKLKRMHDALEVSEEKIHSVMEVQDDQTKLDVINGVTDPFLVNVGLPALHGDHGERSVLEANVLEGGARPLVGETFTDTEPVLKQARRRGHATMMSMTLGTGYDFFKQEHRRRALQEIRDRKPFAQVVAFPCGPWSPLQELGAKSRQKVLLMRWRRRKHRSLTKFSADIAKEQYYGGRHFIIENPSRSKAWKEAKELQDLLQLPGVELVEVDQCQYGLRGPHGGLHRKRTWLVTSSAEVVKEFTGKKCDGSHPHEPVIGGRKVTLRQPDTTPRTSRRLWW